MSAWFAPRNPVEYVYPHGPVAQLAEAVDLKLTQCGFDSRRGYLSHCGLRIFGLRIVKAAGRFQLHLSTLLILAIFAGGFVWLNVRPQERVGKDRLPWMAPGWMFRGFPFKYHEWYSLSLTDVSYRSGWNLALNCCVGLVALTTVGYVCEWVIRRQKVKKL
jgi:hypothetical protein